jgi:hypothetical protein
MPTRKIVRGTTKAKKGKREISDEELEIWAIQQRTKYRNGELPPSHIRKLEEIPGWSWEIDATEDS